MLKQVQHDRKYCLPELVSGSILSMFLNTFVVFLLEHRLSLQIKLNIMTGICVYSVKFKS